jgi:outer membrane protein assembly factor BamB
MFHGDPMHSGRSRYRAPAALPHEAWHAATGGVVYSSPAVADGTLYFGSHDKNVYAVSTDGTLKWRKSTGDLVWCSPALGPDGTVYVGSDDDKIYALDPKDGTVKWSFLAGPCRIAVGTGPEGARCDVDGVTFAAGTIYAAADGVYAVSTDGSLKWKFSPGATHCSSSPAVGPDGTVYVGCQDDALYALDGASGAKRWEFRTGDDVDSSPAVAPDGTVYVGSDDHRLYAFLPGGALKFAVATGGAVRSSPALAADGTIYFGSFDGTIYAVRANGTVAWTYRTADRILSSPVVDSNGLVIIGSEDDRLYAIQPDGRLAWSVLLDGDVDATPALGADGTLYIGTDDRALHALR